MQPAATSFSLSGIHRRPVGDTAGDTGGDVRQVVAIGTFFLPGLFSSLLWGWLIICGTGESRADMAQPVETCIHAVETLAADAANLCDQALKVTELSSEDRAYALLGRGMAADFGKDERAAIDNYDQALTLKPDFATAYLMRGVGHQALGEDDAALADFTKAIALQPDAPAGYRDRAQLRVKRRLWQEALGDLDRVVALSSYDAEMRFLRGYVHEQLGAMDQAKADYTAARALNARIDNEMAIDGIVPQQ
jgi:tetratricopeptide (TPR) repeat protein